MSYNKIHELVGEIMEVYSDHWQSGSKMMDLGQMGNKIQKIIERSRLTESDYAPAGYDIVEKVAFPTAIVGIGFPVLRTGFQNETLLDPSVDS